MTRKENYDELLISGANVADTLAAKAEQSEVDSLSTTVGEKADQDGGGTASLSNYASIDTDELNNVFVARPGELQTTIDDAAAVGPAKVQLVPNENYATTGIEVKGGVTLDFNGAKVVPDTDADMFIMHPNARVFNPHVDVTGLSTYTSAAWVFDTSIVGSFTGFGHYTGIFGGITRGNPGEGTGVYFHNGQDTFIQWVRVAHNISRFDTAIDIYAEGPGGHINANQFEGFIGRANRAVHTRGSDNLDGNTFHLETQSSGGAIAAWVHENGDRNVWRGQAWDPAGTSNGAWWIKSGAGSQNAFYDPQLITVTDHVTDDVGDDSNVARSPGRFVGEAKLISGTQPSVAGSRTFGSWYQNTTGHEMYLKVIVSNSGGNLDMRVHVNNTQGQRVVDRHVAPGTSGENHVASLTAHVPVGSYYRVDEFAGGSMDRWTEHKIGGS